MNNFKLYMHINKINNKKYIGITKQKPEYRWRSDGSGYFRNPYFYNAILKYGWSNFEHVIIYDNLSEEDAKSLEKEYILTYCTQNKNYGYNMTAGGDGTVGNKIPIESVERRANMMRGIPKTEEHKRKISESNKGKKFSEKTKEKLRISHLGHKNTEKQREALKLVHGHNNKIIIAYKENKIIEFPSITKASKFFNCIQLGKNFRRIVDKHTLVCGYYWRYKEVINE